MSSKAVAVFGMGRTGLSVVSALLESNVMVFMLDDSEDRLQQASKAYPSAHAAQIERLPWSQIDYLVLSPGVPLYGDKEHPVVKKAKIHTITIISDLDILYLANPEATFIGITGTNGKSTTTALIGHILQSCGKNVEVGGNIGVPVMQLKGLDQNGFYVLELSSYQLDLTSFLKLDAATILNITPDHIDRHGTFERYRDAKMKIASLVHENGTISCSWDHEVLRNLDCKCEIVKYSVLDRNEQICCKGNIIYDNRHKITIPIQPQIIGEHNSENIAAAYAVCSSLCIASDAICKAISSFKGLQHRMEKVLEVDELRFINDSKATNSDAAARSLNSYRDIFWIAGGVQKQGGISSIIDIIKQNVKMTLLIGKSADDFATQLDANNLPFVKVASIEGALTYIKSLPNPQGTVLLAPACASFDQFRDFEHRGDEFRRLVLDIFMQKGDVYATAKERK